MGHIRPAVMAHMTKHEGKPVTADDLIRVTGFSLIQIQAAMRNLIHDGYPVTVITRAQIWKYDPEPVSEPETELGDVTGATFEGVGRTRSGAVIVRDEHGILYVAREMDV